MRSKQVLRLVLVLLLANAAAGYLLWSVRKHRKPTFSQGLLWRSRSPSETHSPKQVVRYQLEALSRYRKEGTRAEQLGAIEVSYRFASYANRRSTGPLPRFAQMLERGPYSPMLGAQSFTLRSHGDCKGKYARVDSRLIDTQGEIVEFSFYLSRETRAVGSVWSTDGVVRAPKGSSLVPAENSDTSWFGR